MDEARFHLPHGSEKRQASGFVTSSLLCGTCYYFPGCPFSSIWSLYCYCGNIHEAECSYPAVWFDLGSTSSLDMMVKQVTSPLILTIASHIELSLSAFSGSMGGSLGFGTVCLHFSMLMPENEFILTHLQNYKPLAFTKLMWFRVGKLYKHPTLFWPKSSVSHLDSI